MSEATEATEAAQATPEPTPEAAPHVTDHGGGVWGVKVPIPDNPLGHTLVHVLDTDRGPVLIDTGWDDPASWDALAAGLGVIGLAVADVHGVVITHHHPDHHGLSGQVREASGAWIAMHAADTEVVVRTRSAEPGVWFDYMSGKLTAAGAPEEHVAPLRAARASGRLRTLPGLRAAVPDREIVPGELLPLAGRRLRAIWTPGHTPGHVCLHLEEEHPARLPGNGRSSPATTCCPGSPRTSASTRPRRTPASPIPSATTSTPSNASAAWSPPRCSRPTSTPSPTHPPAYGNSWSTTRSG
ncbi:Hydroxyacylglutathione hydrolase OS=Streptomyces lavendulae subsp. lavendulae OX=58340 GN=gloB PE=4 SV=1 [Streptomyces lavendulae subsp. lavendulae]